MIGYDMHFRLSMGFGVVASIAISYLAFKEGYGPQKIGIFAVTALGLSVVAGTAPDLDSHPSKPRQYLGKILLFGSGVWAVWVAANRPELARMIGYRILEAFGLTAVPPWVAGTFIVFIVFIVLLVAARSIGYGLDEFTTHRSLFHSALFAVLVGIAVVVGARQYEFGTNKLVLSLGAVTTSAWLLHTHWADR